jgi:hypothetical protein
MATDTKSTASDLKKAGFTDAQIEALRSHPGVQFTSAGAETTRQKVSAAFGGQFGGSDPYNPDRSQMANGSPTGMDRAGQPMLMNDGSLNPLYQGPVPQGFKGGAPPPWAAGNTTTDAEGTSAVTYADSPAGRAQWAKDLAAKVSAGLAKDATRPTTTTSAAAAGFVASLGKGVDAKMKAAARAEFNKRLVAAREKDKATPGYLKRFLDSAQSGNLSFKLATSAEKPAAKPAAGRPRTTSGATTTAAKPAAKPAQNAATQADITRTGAYAAGPAAPVPVAPKPAPTATPVTPQPAPATTGRASGGGVAPAQPSATRASATAALAAYMKKKKK